MDDLKPLRVLLKPSSVNLICVTAIICGFHLLMSLWSPRRQINYFNEENILDELKRWDEENHHQENDKQLSVINSHHCSSRLLPPETTIMAATIAVSPLKQPPDSNLPSVTPTNQIPPY